LNSPTQKTPIADVSGVHPSQPWAWLHNGETGISQCPRNSFPQLSTASTHHDKGFTAPLSMNSHDLVCLRYRCQRHRFIESVAGEVQSLVTAPFQPLEGVE
jgi:hypothetical protein